MLNLDIKTIAEVTNGHIVCSDGIDQDKVLNTCILGVDINSGNMRPGYMFVAQTGGKDGHSYIDDAINKGAIAIICEYVPENLTNSAVFIVVENSRVALRTLAKYYRNLLGDSLKVVAITGSVGKTSTKEFVANVIAQKYVTHKTQGNRNGVTSLPLEVLAIEPGTEVAVLELGIDRPGEMEILSDIVQPNIGIITNIGNCHLDRLKDRDGVLAAKGAIFSSLKPGGLAVLNGTDDKLITLKSVNGKTPYRFGNPTDNAWVTDVKSKKLYGSDAVIHINMDGVEESFKVKINLPGYHMVSNAMTASIVGRLLDIDIPMIKYGIETTQALPHRSEVYKTSKYEIIDDCYNANAASVKAAIDMLMQGDGRKVAILGNMNELGDISEMLHNEVGAYAAQKHVELMIFVGDKAADMKRGAMSNLVCEGQDVRYFEKKEDLYKELDSMLMDGDTILVKASRGMTFETIIEKLQ